MAIPPTKILRSIRLYRTWSRTWWNFSWIYARSVASYSLPVIRIKVTRSSLVRHIREFWPLIFNSRDMWKKSQKFVSLEETIVVSITIPFVKPVYYRVVEESNTSLLLQWAGTFRHSRRDHPELSNISAISIYQSKSRIAVITITEPTRIIATAAKPIIQTRLINRLIRPTSIIAIQNNTLIEIGIDSLERSLPAICLISATCIDLISLQNQAQNANEEGG